MNEGALGFNTFEEAVDGVSSTVLSNSLDGLEADGIVDRSIVSEKPFRVKYSLTSRGESLEPVIDALASWGQDHLTPPT